MKQSVYIETTIIGHLSSRLPTDGIVAGQMLQTRKWWSEAPNAFELLTSELVRAEASRGDVQAATDRLKIIATMALVPVNDAAATLADLLVAEHAMPKKARVDALHVAIAAINRVDYLLTWNCRHLANATLRATIEQV